MSNPPHRINKPDSRQSQAELDHLAREAMSETSLVPGASRAQAVAQLEYQTQRIRLRQLYIGLTCAAVLILGGGTWFCLHRRAEAAELERQAAARAKLIAETTQQVQSLAQAEKFDEAQAALDECQSHGLPGDAAVELQRGIEEKLHNYRSKLIADAIAARERHDFDQAAKLLKQIKSGRATPSLEDKIQELTRDLDLGASRDLLSQSRKAADKEDWDAALAALGRAQQVPNDGAELQVWETKLRSKASQTLIKRSHDAAGRADYDHAIAYLDQCKKISQNRVDVTEWENKLRDTAGGRLRVDAQPRNATILVPTRAPATSGQEISGLTAGNLRVMVMADGFIPSEAAVRVGYPELTTLAVNLVHENPAPLWVLRGLAGTCAQSLAADFYQKRGPAKALPAAAKSILKPCEPRSSPREKPMRRLKLSDGSVVIAMAVLPLSPEKSSIVTPDNQKREVNNTEITENEEASAAEASRAHLAVEKKRFQDAKGDFVTEFNRLAEFTEQHRDLLDDVLATCGSRIQEGLAVIEHGCGICLGRGGVVCTACEGKGKRKEDRMCSACKGEKRKRCPTCTGTSMVMCSRCHGKGQIKKPLQGSAGGGALDLRTPEMQTCPVCNGSSKIACSKCVKGELQCLPCKGTGRAKELGPCTECDGRGLRPCGICDGSGARDKMKLRERQDMEKALSAACGSP